ncbi:MAG: hypothetical protein V1781_08780 [Bacteroidota bacterium]
MREQFFLLSLAFIAITAFGQNSIPNGNFETWTSGTYDYPQNYPYTSNADNFFRYQIPFNVTKTTNAYHGTYAVQLISNVSYGDTSFGYFINTRPNDKDINMWTGGIPYSQKPTGIRGYYKYNVATADSATIIAAFSKAGSNIGTYIFKIGGVHSTYTLFNLTFSPALPVIPDSVIFAASSSNIMTNIVQGSTLILDSVSFTGVSSQPALMNGDFELWQSQTLYKLNNWYFEDYQENMMIRTTDKVAGDYAIELKTYLGNNNGNPCARAGRISTGYYPNNCHNNCTEMGGYPFSNKVDTLAFWYKYLPSGNDSAEINLNFKKSGSNINQRGMRLHASANYKYVEMPFDIGQTPDTVIVDIQSSI